VNNTAAQTTLGELDRNTNNLSKSLKKVSSGMKINGAGDGASEYSISEKMRVKLRALDQDIQNVQTGRELVATAEGGIQDILDNLRSMKALAINAANDHNTDADRDTIQKEQDARLATIDDIAATTNYNGKLLLRGDYAGPKVSGNEEIGTDETVTMMTNGDYTIDTDGTYMMPVGYSGRITINATNVKIVQEDPAEQHFKTAIECMSAGVSLCLDNVSLINGSNGRDSRIDGFTDTTKNNNTIKFHGAGNTLTICNNVTLVGGCNGGENSAQEQYAVVNSAEGLSIYGKGDNSYLYVDDRDGISGNPRAAGIGSDAGEKLSADITISGLSVLKASSEFGAGIGAGSGGSVGNITISDIGLIRVASRGGAGIGAGPGASCGSISIETEKLYGNVSTTNDADGSVIGEVSGSTCGAVTIDADFVFVAAKKSTASDGSYSSPTDTDGMTIRASDVTVNGTAFDPAGHSYAANASYTNAQVYEMDARGTRTDDASAVEPPKGLVIHTGTRANENLRVFINSMDTESIGVFGVKMKPRESALSALGRIDSAIEYSLNENTRMGAYQSRLTTVMDNLTTERTSTQASESVIRDADMAKEMTSYVKHNVLTQGAQSMLAQANQDGSRVLQLLR
jgi:flagellin